MAKEYSGVRVVIKLMKGKIRKVKIFPQKIEAGGRIKTYLEFSGTLRNGFFDNAIINEDNITIGWNPDPSTYDRDRKSGTIKGRVETTSEWNYFVPQWFLPGSYILSVRVYDDLDGTRKSRRLIARKDVKVEITKSKSDKIEFLFTAYEKLFNRKPHQGGLRNWYWNLQLKGLTKAIAMENGFIKSPEYRLRYFYKFITLGEDISTFEYDKWYNQLIGFGKSDTTTFQKLFSEMGKEARKLTNKKYLEKITATFTEIDETTKEYLQEISQKRKDKVNFTVDIVDNQRVQKLIIFNKFFHEIIEGKELHERRMDYLNGLESFDNLWNRYYREVN